jgi:dTDP-4-dehydrorhamnose reductase
MIRPLVTGSEGLFGHVLAGRLEETYPDTVSATRAFLDITDYWALTAELERLAPNVVVNTAAFSDVDGCELDPEKALRVNRTGPHNLARACRALGAKLVHISTDYVFDGTKATPYGEDDTPAPIQVYGASKRDGELAVLSEIPDALIVRTSFLFGPGRSTFVDRAIERARAGEKVRAVLDWVNSPTYTVDLAEWIAQLIEVDAKGIVHAANSGSCSKFEFARAACRIAAVDDPPIEPIRLADLPLPARRPERTPFDVTHLGALLGEAPRSWEDALGAYLLGEDEADDAA